MQEARRKVVILGLQSRLARIDHELQFANSINRSTLEVGRIYVIDQLEEISRPIRHYERHDQKTEQD